ncbi:hypothetical protein DBR42_22890, partial [Pelomonas sp. HMWF004]
MSHTEAVTVQLRLTRKPGAFADTHALLRWVAGCLNCNTHHVEAVVMVDVPEDEGGGVLSYGAPLSPEELPIFVPGGSVPIPPRSEAAATRQGFALAANMERPASPAATGADAAAGTPAGADCYQNRGGIGLTFDDSGALDGLAGNEMRSLILY